MSINEGIKQLSPSYEGGPKSSDLLPRIDANTDYALLVEALYAVCERQVGPLRVLNATKGNNSRYTGNGPTPETSAGTVYFGTPRADLTTTITTEPLATANNNTILIDAGIVYTGVQNTTETSTSATEELCIRNDNNSPDKKHPSLFVKISSTKDSDKGETSGSILMTCYNPNGTGWEGKIVKEPGSKGIQIGFANRGAKMSFDRQDVRLGISPFSKKVPIGDHIKNQFGWVIDQLPHCDQFTKNPKYFSYSDQYYSPGGQLLTISDQV